ncbi:MAG: flagellar assembly protein FliH [Spirochaetales bacterium]|nr:flagellar assembly protein FliH [Spirochaetales bacterium]
MAKHVFRPMEITNIAKTVAIDAPFKEYVPPKKTTPVEEYKGPTVDDLRREAEAFKAGWEAEKMEMVEAAKSEAQRIVQEAEDKAFEELKQKTDEGQKIRQEAEDERDRIVAEAREEAEKMVARAREEVEGIRETARKEGFDTGREEGFDAGRGEVERLVHQLHTIIAAAIDKRNEIIEQSETQLINLVLLIAKKVVKVISENQKNVVINNVIQALRKLKTRGDVVARVNLEDVELTTEHIKDFMRMVENVRSITVLEDSRVDRGGCIIETDFGEIDARISSQFNEIEEKILELAPIITKELSS